MPDTRFGLLIEGEDRASQAIGRLIQESRELNAEMRRLHDAGALGADVATKLGAAYQRQKEIQGQLRMESKSLADQTAGLETIFKSLLAFLPSFTAGAAVTGFVTMARNAADLQEGLANLTDQLGIGEAFISGLQISAREAGQDFGTLSMGVTRFNVRIAEAARGNKEATQTFRELGVAVRDEATGGIRPTEEILKDVAAALDSIPDPAERARVSVELFSRSGSRFLTTLSADLEANKKRAEELGLVYGTTVAGQVTQVDRSFDRLGTATKGLTASLSAIAAITLAPIIEDSAALAENLAKAAKNAADAFAEIEKMKLPPTVVATPRGFADRAQAQAEAGGNFLQQQNEQLRRGLGLIVPGTTWPPPGPAFPSQEQFMEIDRATGALVKSAETLEEEFKRLSEASMLVGGGQKTMSGMSVRGLPTPEDKISKAYRENDAFWEEVAEQQKKSKKEALDGGKAAEASKDKLKTQVDAIDDAVTSVFSNFYRSVIEARDPLQSLVEVLINTVISAFARGGFGGGGVGGIIGGIVSAVIPFAHGGTIASGIRGSDTVLGVFHRGETAIDSTLTDWLTEQMRASRAPFSSVAQQGATIVNFNDGALRIEAGGGLTDRASIRRLVNRDLMPEIERAIRTSSYRRS